MKNERLFQSQGGPIILSQIENEYGPFSHAFGAEVTHTWIGLRIWQLECTQGGAMGDVQGRRCSWFHDKRMQWILLWCFLSKQTQQTQNVDWSLERLVHGIWWRNSPACSSRSSIFQLRDSYRREDPLLIITCIMEEPTLDELLEALLSPLVMTMMFPLTNTVWSGNLNMDICYQLSSYLREQ